MGKRFIRILVTIAGTLIGVCIGYVVFMLANASLGNVDSKVLAAAGIAVPVFFACLIGTFSYLIEPRLVEDWNRTANKIEKDVQKLPVSQILLGITGLIFGIVLAFVVTSIYDVIEVTGLKVALTALTYLVICSITTVLGARIGMNRVREGEETRSKFFQSITGRRVSKGSAIATPKILDTSVLIDGRIMDLMKTGIIEGQIIIPEYVLTELRKLSDSADPIKKAKGRRGLQILKDIQAYYGIEIYNTYSDKDWDGVEEVDFKLLRLAEKLGGRVVTNDYNLIQVADIQEIPVLNINDVVRAVKTVVIPGEEIRLHITREGREEGQGVGYLEDGTMIVVEDGLEYINHTIPVEVTSVLQTASGRMIFAKPILK